MQNEKNKTFTNRYHWYHSPNQVYVIYELYFSWLDTETGIGGVVLNVGKHGTYRVQLCLVLEKSEFFEQQGCNALLICHMTMSMLFFCETCFQINQHLHCDLHFWWCFFKSLLWALHRLDKIKVIFLLVIVLTILNIL